VSDQTQRRLDLSAELDRIRQELSEAWEHYERLEELDDFYNMNLLDKAIQRLEREYEETLEALYSE